MGAYLTSLSFAYLNQDLFHAALLFYPKVYLPIDTKNIQWTRRDKMILRGPKHIRKMSAEDREYFFSIETDDTYDMFTLKSYLDHKPKLYGKLKNRLLDSWAIDDQTKKFYNETSTKHMKGLSSEMVVEIYSDNVFTRMHEIAIEMWMKTRKTLWINDVDLDLGLMHKDLFVSTFLAENYKIDTIMQPVELEMRKSLLESEDVNLWNPEQPKVSIAKYCPYSSIHQMLLRDSEYKESFVPEFSEVLIPDIGKIPIAELVDFIKKDKSIPIRMFVDELTGRYGQKISKEDITNEVINKLFETSKILWPSLKETTIGLIGNIPSPIIINPVGIMGWYQSVCKMDKVEREYPWILAISDLREKTKKRNV